MTPSKQAFSSQHDAQPGPWSAFPWEQLHLKPSCIEIGCATISTDPAQLDALSALLSADELQRLARIGSIHKRHETIYSRGMLRRLLGSLLDTPPQTLELLTGEKGKPTLTQLWHGHQVEFNLSHSGGLLLIAVALDLPLGIDVEQLRPNRPWQGIARRFFHPAEYAAIRALPTPKQEQAFYTCWCRKEAYLKAMGGGIALGLGNFQVSVEPDVPPHLIASTLEPGASERWSLHDLWPDTDYQASLAITGEGLRLRKWNLDTSR